MIRKETFSLRKYKIGTVSVLLGAVFLLAGQPSVAADDLQPAETTTQLTVSDTTIQEVPLLASQVENQVVLGDKQESTMAVVADESPVLAPSPTPVEEAKLAQVATETSLVQGNTETRRDSETETSAQVVAVGYQAPQAKAEEASPQNIDSNTIVTVPQVWQSGYKGEGQVVAIIDSGLDVDHDALRISDLSKAKYKTKEELEVAKVAAGIDYGQWYNDKVVFGHNYVDVNNKLKEEEKRSHGMHVTGIATGNPSKEVAGELIYGVAPEAQVMFMRVFSDLNQTTNPALYVRAIEDAVKLGADSINLSLGGANGSVVNMDETVTAAIELARKSGVTVVISAGNDGAFGSGHSLPAAENPDYGLVSNPSTARDVISVASYNNTTMANKVLNILGLEDNAELNYGRSSFANPDKSDLKFEEGRIYEYVAAGLGLPTDFDGLDLTGKLALIKRGEITFTEKIANAAAAGAIGVVVYNNRPGEANITMSLEEAGFVVPSLFIPYEFGEALAANAYKIQLNNESVKEANPQAGRLSDFTSWGLSADGELKPDLSAPGGFIYAAINDNDYGSMSGTSMAAPHVAGAAVLVKQHLQTQYPEKTAQEIEALIKHLLMSTAQPHVNQETGAYTSPRQQGAGIMDTAAAISRQLYLTGEEGYSSVTLGNVEDQFSFDLTIHNLSQEDRTLDYVTHLNTDTVADGFITLAPRALAEIPGGRLTVKANQSTTVRITVDASTFREELLGLMKNGYFLEGFVRFTDATDGSDLVSIPYVGFRGAFQNLPVVEEPIYNLLADGKGGFYFEPVADEARVLEEGQHYTGLVTGQTELIYSTDDRSDFKLKALGTFKNEAGRFVLQLDETGKPHLALSPNGDNNQDSLAFRGVFLRNYTNLVASVYAATDLERQNPLWTSKPQAGNKNFYADNPELEKSSLITATEWAGKDQEGSDLPDGKYQYVLTYSSEVPGADQQTMIFDVIVDRQAPVITTATYDDKTFNFRARKALDRGESGIFREQVFYLVADESGQTTLVSLTENGGASVADNKVFVARNTDGSFTLPLDLADLSKFYYTVEDFAGNVTYAKVQDLLSIGNDRGLVTVNMLDKETNQATPVEFSYAVRDQAGNLVTELPRYAGDKQTLMLPFGTYTFDLFLYNKEWATVAGETKVTVTIDEKNSKEAINFYVTVRDKASLLVDVDKQLPVGSSLGLETPEGQLLILPNAKYSKTDYGKFVPLGEYKLVVNLPEGYEFLEDLTVSVLADKANVKTLTLLDKRELLAQLAALLNVEKTPAYYNADLAQQVAYQQALTLAQTTVSSKQTQEEIDTVLAALVTAKDKLQGQPTDRRGLQAEIDQYQSILANYQYYNATKTKQVQYETLVRSAQLVLADEQASQVSVNQALSSLSQAREELDGQETDYRALRDAVGFSSLLKATAAKYKNASETSKVIYDKAVELAQALLATKEATQDMVDQALAQLTEAHAGLDGRDSAHSEQASSSQETEELKEEQASPPDIQLNQESQEPKTEQETSPARKQDQKISLLVSETDYLVSAQPLPTDQSDLMSVTAKAHLSGNGIKSVTLVAPSKTETVSATGKRALSRRVVEQNLPQTAGRQSPHLLVLGLVLTGLTLGQLVISKRRKSNL
ncbi:S8 family serine peptidase [Streptococcus cuniculipharyngis]|uniref:S8 family serine peptidase n=1 Tax=Streptococcus cuniculipharyngis TaxID=1562651 RepID=A0A5C5SDQ7_9STRE|nr:S8 family serine peptidase [Streptococcus cuniculipharyngis]TWS99086.1 S8 family serine peptidase [Streptococcus cuniculipharyngis]